MSNLLISEHPLQVLPSLAKEVGLNEAIFLQQLHYWLLRSNHTYDNKRWIYNTYEGWAKQFPFWSESTIRRIVKNLREQNYISATDRFNKDSTDRTLWYAIEYQNIPSGQFEHPTTRPIQNEHPHEVVNMNTPPVQNEHVINKETETTTENTNTETTEDCPAGAERSLTPWQEFIGAFCWVCFGHDRVKALTKEQTGQLTSEAKKIKELGFDIDDLRIWYKEVWRPGWQYQKDSNARPIPSYVRTSLPSIRADIPHGFDAPAQVPLKNGRMSKIDNNMVAFDQAMAYIKKHGVNPL